MGSSRLTRAMRTRSLLWFFGLAYAVSWALWFAAVLASFSVIGPLPSRYLHLAGGLGPMLAAVIVASLAQGQPGLMRLAKRCAAGGRREHEQTCRNEDRNEERRTSRRGWPTRMPVPVHGEQP